MPEFNRRSLSAVVACGVGLALAYGTVIIATFGLFMIAMSQEFHWSGAQISGLLTAAALCQAPCSLILGRLIDRVGVRRVVLPGMAAYGGSVMALASANGSLPRLYVLFMLVGVTSSTVTMLPYSKVITGWFHARRGLMLSVYSVLAALLGAAAPQLARWLIDAYGWRIGYLVLGAAVIVVGLPVLALLLHEPAALRASVTRVTSPAQATVSREALSRREDMSAAQARSTATYWWLILAITLCSIAIQGVYAHMAPLLTGRGLSRTTATNALSFYVIASMAAQLVTGFFLDRASSPRVAVPALTLALGGLALLYVGDGPSAAVIGGALMGACVGAEMSAAKFLHARYFGQRAFGELFGLQFLFIGLSAGIGPIGMGALHDATGNYRLGILVSAAFLLISITIIACLPRFVVGAALGPAAKVEPNDRSSTAFTVFERKVA